MTRVLILGGTGEATELAARLVEAGTFDVSLSLAGRTAHPAQSPCPVRTGGFGGADGLAEFLRCSRIDILVDATHPFAVRISVNARAASVRSGVPLVSLCRRPWVPGPSDNWHAVENEAAAAAALPSGARAFLALGAGRIGAFNARTDIFFVARMIDPPAVPPLATPHEIVLDRGPFDRAEEVRLFGAKAITHLVARNAGGDGARAKIDAASALRLPVLMICRPKAPEDAVGSVDDAMTAIIDLAR